DVGRPDGEAVVDGMNVVTDGLVVLSTRLDGDDFADLAEERLVKGRCHADRLREEGGIARPRHAVEALTPVVVCRASQAWDCWRSIDHLGCFLVKGHARDEIVRPLLHWEGGVLERERASGLGDGEGGKSQGESERKRDRATKRTKFCGEHPDPP